MTRTVDAQPDAALSSPALTPQAGAAARLSRRGVLGAAMLGGLVASLAPLAARARGVVRVSEFYMPSHGRNVQPAFQAAIDAAARSGATSVVNDLGMARAEMWCPRRTARQPLAADGIPLIVREPVDIDFAGIELALKGAGGGRREQAVPGIKGPWLGGWLYVVGHARFSRISIANVVVDGGITGPYDRNGRANLTDKAFRIQDTDVAEVRLRGVELRNFGGEIYYIGGRGPEWQYLDDCHFHGSPQAAFNPGGVGRLRAVNVRAGRAYQAAEIIGGKGHTYQNCRFYDSVAGGITIFGGPAPGFVNGLPYWFALWDGRGERPWVTFDAVTFDRCGQVRLGSWMRGRCTTIDTAVVPLPGVGHLRDIDLAIDSRCDRRNDLDAVAIGGPRTPREALGGAKGQRMTPPSNLRFDITCSRTAAARAAGRAHSAGVRFMGGLVDPDSIRIAVRGEARQALAVNRPAPGFRAPRVTTSGFTTVG